ncbi:cell division protein FtsQ/DivIB [Streptococcus macedonicus]|uniref:Cell division protein DivIB n=1 Tax=Streptococcus macedonicus TaxID=59310 RepID=A0AA47FDG2_STRMC|nr:FtsQ-type POTRA domain-containing protein [Streptococcus macedonicus]CCF01851.1 Division initiation protein [Streptococcus macedonicus ACA-DC 198]MCW8485304.1 FtsQ-type POTRA domain-containing protein [Streptococcus macedonicus]MCW8493526.1 FtsQ-type POTRA domain-containing protein [Streptococcus macedonicus]MCW8498779.1 FtsQ-type POTRA domain-containing protein [Streptococcus macedonicus]MCW8500961.1 FtsQ-type POTRA domain-containing protein [Streptococcus macedonicus]
MTKEKEQDKKESKTQNDEKLALTEWQKRNIEFLKKKEAEEAEKKKRQEKLRLERTPHVKKEDDDEEEKDSQSEKKADKETTNGDADEQEIVSKKEKKQKAKQAKKARKEKKKKEKKEKKELTQLQKARCRAYPVLIVAGAVLLISLFLVTPISKQKTVTVSGTSTTTSDSVLTASGIKSSDYFFSLIFNHSAYEKSILKNDKMVKEAKIVYYFPNKFMIKVKEYDIVAYAQTDDGYQPILENGTHLDVVGASELPDTFLTINLSSESDIQKLIKAFSKLDKDLVSQIQIVSSANSSTTADLLLLEMHDGNTVRVPLSEIVEKLPYYTKIKGNLTEASIVDMEVGIYTTTETIESEAAAEKESASSESSAENTESSDTESTTKSSEETQTESSDTEVSTEAFAVDGASDNNSTTEENPNNMTSGMQVGQQ